ncbi:DRAP deaminase [Vermiconidia calcicola]|uniref:DRAP deaminase n=1 Tax=Vermiconidia calcicola TaxID=1690605 RepID=A0ACC3MQ70_9PEZI|nr:DRAP deaminase [Vermiconidia calcicola]
MALTVVEPPPVEKEILQPPPAVALTPCDPWPRPYYLEGGLRRWCKQRWRGREILDIFRDEFRDRTPEYYAQSISSGAIQLNGKPVESTQTTVKNGDIISHTLHRHEPPVTAQPIGIVHEDEDVIVINKPAGVPVHPAGRYNYNSLIEIMRAERGGGWNPLPCNRLDRLTSGIMFIAKHKKSAEKLTVQLTQRTIRKQYVARVKGEFPKEEVVCEQPILQISPKLGLNRVRANGKEARTVFRRLAYYPTPEVDGSRQREGYSIVRCLPLTGRTHQLRVHLQFLGHPITNDPIYSNARVFGPDLGRNADTAEDDESIMDRLGRMGKDEVAEAIAYHDEMVADYEKKKAEKMTGSKCDVCGTDLYSDPGPHELGIYLHAQKYACMEDKWSYETPLPEWALPPPGYEEPAETAETDLVSAELEKLELEKSNNDRPSSIAVAG